MKRYSFVGAILLFSFCYFYQVEAQTNITYSNAQNIVQYKMGSRGAGVKSIQQILKKKGFYTGKIDGSYGPKTRDAVRWFQINNNIIASGEVDDNTLAKIKGIPSSGSFSPSSSGIYSGGTSNTNYLTPPLYISSYSPLSNGRIGIDYNTNISASGGSGSYSWRLASGSLPPGLILVQEYPPCASNSLVCPVLGKISGIPDRLGTYIFLLEVAAIPLPGAGPGPTLRATKQFIITIGS